jgi:competence ComEA-like helix-hairpin-helix protein
MFPLTKQERMVVLSFGVVLLLGTAVDYVLKKVPQLKDAVNLLESDHIYYKLDLNTATEEELIRLPYIGPATARRILEYRREHGNFSSVDEVLQLKGIYRENFEKFRKFLYVRDKGS